MLCPERRLSVAERDLWTFPPREEYDTCTAASWSRLFEETFQFSLPGSRHRGIKGVGENLHPARVPLFWVGRRGRTATRFPRGPGWVSGCGKPLDHSSAKGGQGAVLGNRFSVLGIPDTTGHLRRAENKIGNPGVTWSSPGPKRGEGRERGGTGWFPRGQESLAWSVAGAQEGLLVGG